MKSSITAIFAMIFFFLVGSASAATSNFSINGLKSIQSDTFCADEDEKLKKKKKLEEEEEEEPECD